MRIFWLFCALGALLGCRQVSEPSGTAIALFCSTSEQSKTDILTQGDEIAVFARIEGTASYFLEAVKFTVKADGHSLMTAPAVAYPETNQAIHFFAYFPYHKGTFSVPTDQSTAKALKQADLCGAVASTTPVAAPVALEFKHLMARVVITTNKPTTRISFPNAIASGTLNAATAEFVLGAERKDIWTESTTSKELIVPVQPLTRLVLTVAGVEYVFDTAPIALQAGQTTTLNLTLHPNTKTATLTGSSITNWVASSTTGNLTQAVSNTLTVHWPKCHPQSNAVNRIVLTIKDEVSGVTANYAVANGITYANQTFTIPFASSALHYPYTVVSMAFYQANTFLHESMSLLGGTIIKSGACVVGIRQPLNTPAAADYVVINGLKWAKGNLVAVSKTNNHECKIGAPADYGLYFPFGSLIGYKGGALANGGTGVGSTPYTTNGDKWWGGASSYSWSNDAMVYPSDLVGTKASWAHTTGSNIATLSDYYFNYSAVPWERAQNIRDFAVAIVGDTGAGTLATGRYAPKGVGDPCSYYLGGAWRLPRGAEYAVMCNNQLGIGSSYTWSAVGGQWVVGSGGYFANKQLFFPTSGYRLYSNGSFTSVILGGYGWSSSVYTATQGLLLRFNSGEVQPQFFDFYRSTGFPVRCVSE